MRQLKFTPLTTTLILAGIFSGAAALNFNDYSLLGDLNDILKVDSSVTVMLDWFMRLSDRCKKNNVKLDLKTLFKAYTCLGDLDDSSTPISGNTMSDSYFDKICNKWPSAMKCFRPILKQVELCFSGGLINLEGVLTEGVAGLHKPICSADTAFVDAIVADGPAAVGCLTNHTEVVVKDVIDCYTKRSPGDHEICQSYEVYFDCFMQSLDICNNGKVEKLVNRLMEQAGLKKVIYKYILKCKPIKEEL